MTVAAEPTSGKRLLFVVNVMWFFLSHRFALAVAARNHGYEVHVAAGGATPAEIERVESAGIRFHSLELSRSDRNALTNLRLLCALVSLYKRFAPDIVHHVTVKPVMLGTLAARWTGVRAVVNAVSGLGYAFTDAARSRSILRRILELGYRLCLTHPRMLFIFQNQSDRATITRLASIDRSQVLVIPGSGVDLREFVPHAEPLGEIRILLPARMLKDKGVVEFAAAIKLIKASGVDAIGLLAGGLDPDNPAAMTEADIRALESESGVRWLGHQESMSRLCHEIHIVCLPSYREGLPKALIEAAAAGRPIVTTDVPGCRDVVNNGVEGFLTPVRDVPALAAALTRLAVDPALRLRMGRAARLRAEREFSLEHVVEATLRAYERVLAK